MLPIEAHLYDAWAGRIEDALEDCFPACVWVVIPLDELMQIPHVTGYPAFFRVVAVSRQGLHYVTARLPYEPVVDEELFPRVIAAVGWEMERRLASAAQE